jgi:predicted RNase H-like nuclease (RuvC/YqgF family)
VFQFNCAFSTFSSERTDQLLLEDADNRLDALQADIKEIKDFKNDLKKMDTHLKESKKGQSIYVKFDTIAGSAVAVAIIIGSYKAHFPPGFRAMVSAYTTVTGASHGFIKLNEKHTKIFLGQVRLLNQKVIVAEGRLEKQINYYCKISSNHQLCSE